MKFRFMIVVASLFLGISGVHAAPIQYQGTATLPSTNDGTVGGFGFFDNVASDVDFWRFNGIAGTGITIRVTRLDTRLDPVLVLYAGQTTADESTFVCCGGNFGGLTALAIGDDEIDVPGPFGDPLISLLLPFTGAYTIMVAGAASDALGPLPYRLTVVPVPATLPLLIAGFGALGWSLRRRVG